MKARALGPGASMGGIGGLGMMGLGMNGFLVLKAKIHRYTLEDRCDIAQHNMIVHAALMYLRPIIIQDLKSQESTPIYRHGRDSRCLLLGCGLHYILVAPNYI